MPTDRVSSDPAAVVEAVNHRYGYGLVVQGRAVSGETAGATYVRWPDARRSVVTLASVPVEVLRRTGEVLGEAGDRGAPVPRHELVLQVADQVVVVQERLPGRHLDPVDVAAVETLIAADDGFAGLLAARPDVPAPALHLTSSGPVLPRHEVLAGHSAHSRRLLERIRAIGRAHPEVLTGTDLVHTDCTVPDVLVDDHGAVGAIVDWNNGAARGDRHFTLVELLFDLTWDAAAPGSGRHHTQPEALEHLHQRLIERLDPPLLRACWAHWTLVMLH